MATINPTEAAKRLGITRARVHQLINAGTLPATRWGIYWMIEEADIAKRAKAKRKAKE